jgi:hypothetical protein
MTKPKRPRPLAAVAAKKKASGGPGVGLTVVMPPDTLVALKTTAAQTSSTVRALVLDALRKAGYPVPAHELTDRRRK